MKTQEYWVLCTTGLVVFLLSSQTLEKIWLHTLLGLSMVLIAHALLAKEKISQQAWFKSTHRFWSRFNTDQSAVTAVEYALITAAIVFAIIVAVKLIGTNTSSTFNTVATAV